MPDDFILLYLTGVKLLYNFENGGYQDCTYCIVINFLWHILPGLYTLILTAESFYIINYGFQPVNVSMDN